MTPRRGVRAAEDRAPSNILFEIRKSSSSACANLRGANRGQSKADTLSKRKFYAVYRFFTAFLKKHLDNRSILCYHITASRCPCSSVGRAFDF